MTMTLSKREKDIMTILWESEIPLKASDFSKINSSLNINTIQSVLTKLLKKDLVKVDKIDYSGTVLARCYIPAVTPEEFALKQLDENIQKFSSSKPISKLSSLISYFLDDIEDQDSVITELEKMLSERKTHKKE